MEDLVIDILKKLRLFDDATVMDSLVEKGMPYKKIRGVSIPELREIAKIYAPNQALAEQLWHNSTREVKLLAILIADADKMTETVFEQWLKDFNSSEFAEQACMSFLPHTQFAASKIIIYTEHENSFAKQTGIVLAARLIQLDKELSETIRLEIVQKIPYWASMENIHIQRAVARLINALCSKNLKWNVEMQILVEQIEQMNQNSVKWIVEEVKWNINYNKEKLSN
jgi:3-methyladenine DNA glycosylase AlkD